MKPIKWLSIAQLSKLRNAHFAYWKVRDGHVFHQGRLLRKANPDTFEVLYDPESFVARDDKHVFFAWSMLPKVDRKSFEALGDRYFRDRSFAYTEYETSLKPLKGQDSKNFRVVGCGYARDAAFGYFWGAPLRKCESPLDLKVVKATDGKTMDYAMDRDRIYCEAAELKGADLASWRPLKRGFSIDENAVFFLADRLPKVDCKSWKQIGDGPFSCDGDRVYLMAWPLRNANPARWKRLKDEYSTDGERVYYLAKQVEDADAATFEVTSGGKARDKFGTFDDGVRVGGSRRSGVSK